MAESEVTLGAPRGSDGKGPVGLIRISISKGLYDLGLGFRVSGFVR